MSTPNVFVKVGTTLAKVKPENTGKYQLLLERASKIKSPKQFRAAVNATKCLRSYPRFVEGTSVEQYVIDYFALNNYTLQGSCLASGLRAQARGLTGAVFQPLSTLPMFAQSGEVLEEESA